MIGTHCSAAGLSGTLLSSLNCENPAHLPHSDGQSQYDGPMPWISFDLDGTICDFPMYHAVFKTMRAHWPEEARAALGTLYQERLASADPIQAFDWDEMNLIVAVQHSLEPLPDILEFAAKQYFASTLVYADTQPALAQLRSQGWQLACGTNGYAKYQAYALERLGILVDAFIAPDTVGFAKPQAEFLRSLPSVTNDDKALEGLVHVGDILTQDVLAANRTGVTSAWVWRDMPEEIRLKATASRALDPEVIAKISELAELEFAVHGQMDGSYTDFPPKPDFVVADLLELVNLISIQN
jgi:FMN hydrolase / 5-amino-6-(5-phospho-D-ribitylamino)uracil phosphatase